MNEEIKIMLSEEETRIKAKALLKMPPVDLITKYMFQEQLITNLQEENCKLRETNEEHRKINGELRKENQKLVKVIDELEKYIQREWNTAEFSGDDFLSGYDTCIREMKQDILNKLTELKGGSDDE